MIAIVLFALLIDIYAFQAVRTVFDSTPMVRNPAVITYWTISILIYVMVAVGVLSYFNLTPIMKRFLLGTVICVGIAKIFIVSILIFDDGVRLFRYFASFFNWSSNDGMAGTSISRSEFLSRSALITGGFMFSLFAWGMIRTAYQYTVHRQTLKFKNLPDSFRGLKIVQISDAHLGSFLNTEPVEKAINMINELDADIVFCTGEMVNSISKEAEPFIGALSKIRSKYGVYSVLGNHDYGSYYRWESEDDGIKNLKRLQAIHAECGWTLLNNDNRMLDIDGARIAIIGVENWGKSEHFPKAGDLKKASAGTSDANLKLLLSHDPSHWNSQVTRDYQDIDVTFSGHTHGFQMGVEIPWLNIKWSPSKYVYKQWAGLYQQGKQYSMSIAVWD